MLCLSQRNAGSKQGFAFLSLSPELICISEPCTALLPKINPALTQALCCAGVTPMLSPPSVLAQPRVPGWDPGDIGVSPSSASSPCSLQCTSLSWAPRRVQLPRSFPRACPHWRYLWTPPRSRCGLSPAASPPGQLETDRKRTGSARGSWPWCCGRAGTLKLQGALKTQSILSPCDLQEHTHVSCLLPQPDLATTVLGAGWAWVRETGGHCCGGRKGGGEPIA